jgi:hypothetical protein
MATPGYIDQLGVLAVFSGGQGVEFIATGAVRTAPSGVYSIRCTTAGTVKLWDSLTGSGKVLLETIAMTAGQIIKLNYITDIGVFATVTSGTYTLIDTVN